MRQKRYGEHKLITQFVIAEKEQLRVELKRLRVIKVDTTSIELGMRSMGNTRLIVISLYRVVVGGTSRHGRGALWLRAVLLLELTTAFSFLTLDALPLCKRKHFLVLDSKLATANLTSIEILNNSTSLFRGSKVGKRETPEYSVVKVVVERIRNRKPKTSHDLEQLLLLDCKRNVLNDDSSWDQLIVLLATICTVAGIGIITSVAAAR
jgi:hypothetical protein